MNYVQIIIGFAVAIMGTQGVVEIVRALSNRKKVAAEASNTGLAGQFLILEQYQKYAVDLERRMKNMETAHKKGLSDIKKEYQAQIIEMQERSDANRRHIQDLERLIEKKDAEHSRIISEKNNEIAALNARVDELQDELTTYKASQA